MLYGVMSGFKLRVCSEYESEYEGGYIDVYDQNFVFYDENEVDSELQDYEEYDSEIEDNPFDVILEEIPFVYCPSVGEVGEA